MNIAPIDLSKAPHPKIIDLILPLMPGLFFGLSLLLSSPNIWQHLESTGIYQFGYYSRLALGLFCAYFVGMVFFVLSGFIQNFIVWIYRKLIIGREKVIEAIPKILNRRVLAPNSSTSKSRNRICRWCLSRQVQRETNIKALYRVWSDAATVLLKNQYGLDASEKKYSNDEWGVWIELLGSPSLLEVRGSSILKSLHASGWIGLAAIAMAPALRTPYYVIFTTLLLVIGFFNDILVASAWVKIERRGFNRTAWILRDIRRGKKTMNR